MIQKIREVAKMLAALAGSLAVAGSTLIPETWSPWLTLILVVATAVATYAVPNAQAEEPQN